MKKILLFLLLFTPLCYSQQPLPAEQAFILSANIEKGQSDNTVSLQWQMAKGHYLYRERFKFKTTNPRSAKLGPFKLPQGQPKQDEIFGKYQVI